MLVAGGTACSKSGGGDLGEPGEAADVDQVIEIEMTDQLSFDPSEIDISAGETVEFRLTNTASSPHEFVLGDNHEHSDDMQHADENATGAIEPGGHASVIWRFPETGEANFACYIDGHNEAGMTGTVSVE
jgi:uncharacterized cupredoxin-like copper-binding protein